MSTQVWISEFSLLALRLDRAMRSAGIGSALLYTGPPEPRIQADNENPPPAAQLADDCRRLREQLPSTVHTAYVASQLDSMSVFARRIAGEDLEFQDFTRQALGVDTGWQHESIFEDAHARLDAALPKGAGSLATRLDSWRQHHTHTGDQQQLREILTETAAECKVRTTSLISLPDMDFEVVFDSGPHRGDYQPGRATIYINDAMPFNLADSLYVVAHEGFPGHIAETALKYPPRAGHETHVRFMTSPSFVVSEGIGLHAPAIAFGDGREWLRRHVLAPLGISDDGSDFDTIHAARNALWGVWSNAAFLAAEGHDTGEIRDYLTRWGLLSDAEADWAVTMLSSGEFMRCYVLGYFHGWRLLNGWLDHPDRHERFRRLLATTVLPADMG